jgi:hypothetical protein
MGPESIALEASLGKLVKFDQRQKPPVREARAGGSAQILLFTGVRYERGTPPVTTIDPSRPKRKRG